ncbi:hypothetical protein [Streptomyces lydicus]|uniref:hypothetical protein n=1 Tax=Streptomyces lydicus TaxID=47763 RepID=UPI0036EF76FF
MSRSPSLFGKKLYLRPGETVAMRVGPSEATDHMRVSDKAVPVRITDGELPMAQLLGDYEKPFSFPILLGEAGLHTDDLGIWSDRILDLWVRWTPTATPTWFYLFGADGLRYLNPFRTFEEARDRALSLDGVEVRQALPARALNACWFRYVPVPLEAKITYRYEVWGQTSKIGWKSRSEKLTDSKVLTDDETVLQFAQGLSKSWGYGVGVKDAFLYDAQEHEPCIFGGRQILWEG